VEKGERPAGRSPFSHRNLAAGAGLFLVLTVGGLAALAWTSHADSVGILQVLGDARPWYLVLAVTLALLELTMGASRVWVLARHVRPAFRWRQGLEVQLYNVFAAGMTPAQAGSAPAQFYVLRRAGVRGGRAVAVLTVTWVSTISALLVFGAVGMAYLVHVHAAFAVSGLLRGLLATALILGVAGFLMIMFPAPLERLLLGTRLRRSPRGHRLLRAISSYRRAVRHFMKKGGRRAWLANAMFSWAMLLLRCLVGVAVLAAIGVAANPLSAISRQALQFAVIYFSPSPGGSGVAELTSLGLMAGLVPATLLVSYTMLWRAATAYVGILLGGVYVGVDLLRSLSRWTSREHRGTTAGQ